jgi:predicted HAD superfamily phosphohydrolase
MSSLKLDRLRLRQTAIDTTVVARHTDKGKGLLALKTLAGQHDAETVAVGDTESDLPMFAVSQRSFAPGNMKSCRPIAKSMGCKVVSGEYQVGLLQIAQAIVHPERENCSHCQISSEVPELAEQDLLLNLLKAADESRWSRLFGALLDPMSVEAFRK